jgi:MYXO-CTERM domain-containing protein
MDGFKALGLGRWAPASAAALLFGIVAACAAPTVEPSKGTSSAVTDRPFDRNSVIDDTSMRDAEAMTVADVQKFLEKTPWGTKSALAKYTENGKTAAEIMVEAAQSHGINPLEMLVRVQMEQGLVSKTTASATTISLAFGCGCPHSPICSDKYRGFSNQADCAAGTMRRSMDKALTTTGTVSGWGRGKTKDTEDGVTVLPKNAATAALYTYTPWVGEAGGGKKGVGGVSLHAQVWDRFAESVSYGAWAPPASSNASNTERAEPDAGADEPDPTVDPPADPGGGGDPEPAPEPDAAPSHADAGTHVDAGPTGEGSESTNEGKGAPDDGSEDGNILGEGSAPPSSNAAPPSTKTRTPSRPEELPEASEEELAAKKKAAAGCSTTGQTDSSSTGFLLAGLATVLVLARRKRS